MLCAHQHIRSLYVLFVLKLPINRLIPVNDLSQRSHQATLHISRLNGTTRKRYFILAHIKLGLPIILLSLTIGCAHKADDTGLPKLEWTGKSAMHHVRSATLRSKMRSLKVLMFENMYDELQFDKQRARQAKAIADIANTMAAVALDISAVQKELDLDAAYVPVFRYNAQRLKKQAMALRDAALHEKSEVYPSMIRAIVKTCNDCHNELQYLW